MVSGAKKENKHYCLGLDRYGAYCIAVPVRKGKIG